MKQKRTKEQVISWLQTAQKRQQDWQQEVKLRWNNKNSLVKAV